MNTETHLISIHCMRSRQYENPRSRNILPPTKEQMVKNALYANRTDRNGPLEVVK